MKRDENSMHKTFIHSRAFFDVCFGVVVMNVVGFQEGPLIEHTHYVWGVDISPDTRIVSSASDDTTIKPVVSK